MKEEDTLLSNASTMSSNRQIKVAACYLMQVRNTSPLAGKENIPSICYFFWLFIPLYAIFDVSFMASVVIERTTLLATFINLM